MDDLNKYLLTTSIAGLMIFNISHATNQSIKLVMDNRPPFHYSHNNKLVGPAIKALKCAFKRMSQAYNINIASWSRAQHYVKIGHADGFFAASHNDARDKYATLTHPFVDQYWSWFTLTSRNISKK
ncbi:hypothetical protein [Piscirickettsia litoralis]|uniref:hypothetical protein n=1 Tax=Piscirickettsia litoralis TaxID=1891921 RepID=UPI001F2E8C79|nr:hypothetical protein [Piscirickettsia litoralis]